MSAYLPSSTSLATFERLFRVRSINKVAEQLHMTPPAVSYQINTLENMLGQKLFIRSPKGVEPTQFAEAIYFDTTVTLEHVRNIVRRAREHQHNAPVRILATQALATLWLLPKMPGLLERFDGVHFEIISWTGGFDHSDSNRSTRGYDFEFRYARQEELGRDATARLISHDRAIVVCAPRYLDRFGAICDAESLSRATVLHARNWPGIWERWCEGAFQRTVTPADDILFQGTSLCVQAALGGLGMAIVHAPLVADELRSERLVIPHAFALPVEESYFAVLGDSHSRHAGLFEGFATWCTDNMQ